MRLNHVVSCVHSSLFTADERRPSTGSSLYHKVYSSSSSESGSGESESEDDEDDEEEESEEGSDEESESESESDDESESECEKDEEQEGQHEDKLIAIKMEAEKQIERDQEITPVVVEKEQGEFILK